jgi:hypothetical protein
MDVVIAPTTQTQEGFIHTHNHTNHIGITTPTRIIIQFMEGVLCKQPKQQLDLQQVRRKKMPKGKGYGKMKSNSSGSAGSLSGKGQTGNKTEYDQGRPCDKGSLDKTTKTGVL